MDQAGFVRKPLRDVSNSLSCLQSQGGLASIFVSDAHEKGVAIIGHGIEPRSAALFVLSCLSLTSCKPRTFDTATQ
jgi:hypothetical protein